MGTDPESSKLARSVNELWRYHEMATPGACIANRRRGTDRLSAKASTEGSVMAQAITSWFICDGRFRVHAINAVGRRRARIIEIEEVDTGERFHGSARRLQRLFQTLGSGGVGELVHVVALSRNQAR